MGVAASMRVAMEKPSIMTVRFQGGGEKGLVRSWPMKWEIYMANRVCCYRTRESSISTQGGDDSELQIFADEGHVEGDQQLYIH